MTGYPQDKKPDSNDPLDLLYAALEHGYSWRIAEAVHQAELTTSGEIIVRLTATTPEHDSRRVAEAEYQRLGLADHPHQHGVLIYVSLNLRKVEIVVGPEAAEEIPQDIWQKCAAEIATGFRDGNPADGIIRAVNCMATPLAQHFPSTSKPGPELPNVTGDEQP